MTTNSGFLFEQHSLPLHASSEQIDKFATTLANSCYQICTRAIEPLEVQVRKLNEFSANFGLSPLSPKHNMSQGGIIARFKDKAWWTRQIRKIQRYETESREIQRGKVHRFSGCYVSDYSLQRRKANKIRSHVFLTTRDIVNEEGLRISLSDAIKSSVANPKNRRAEMMCHIAGDEKYAQEAGHVGTFLTFTCPSRMHARLSKSGKPNPNYDCTTPKEAHRYLNTVWSRIRAKLHRSGITVYGLRVVEPQHDGTPHWHLLLFHDEPHFHELSEICRHYNLADSPEERGAHKHRVDIKPIDWSRGTAAGYVAKYVSKNIDGAYLDTDTLGNDAAEAAERIEAWASTWSIRQFQFIGAPAVTIWRELRKIKANLPTGKLRQGQKAADQSDWYSFIKVMWNRSKEQLSAIKLEKTWNDITGKYGDPKGMEIFGVSDEYHTFQTRIHEWKIVEKLVGNNNTVAAIAQISRPQCGGDCAQRFEPLEY